MSYPLTYPDNGDARFTGELIDEIGAVLTAHGYPPVDGDDTAFAGLREALRGFLYGPEFDRGDEVTWFRNGKVWSGRARPDRSAAKLRVPRDRHRRALPRTHAGPGRCLT